MRIFGSKRQAGLFGLVLATGFALTAITYAAVTFGPSRQTFTWANPASYITFNSITNNPDTSIGDERTFISARDFASSDKLTYTKSLNVKDNQEVLVRVFFHNDAGENLNLVAINTKAKVVLPAGSSTSPQAVGFISADNSTPKEVWSTMDFKSNQPFTMEYVPGSAQLWTQFVNGASVSDSIVTTGALIGSKGTDGKAPGCAQFSGFVTIKVRIHMPQPPAPEAKFACKALDVVKVDRTRFDFTARATAENATVQNYVFTTKNSSGNIVDTTTVTTDALSAVYHFNQSTAGTYTVSVVVNTDKGSTNTTSACTKQVTVDAVPTSTPTPTTTPPQVLSTTSPLPNTGAGSMVGLFTGASALGAIGHYLVRRRLQ